MGIYKIFPEKDTTIYSEFPSKNTGIDEILEINAYTDISGRSQVARTLIKFSQSDITNVVNLVSGSYEAFLRLYLATAQEIPSEYTVYGYHLTENWEMGLGRYSTSPSTNQGATWTTRSIDTLWSVTGSTYDNSFEVSQSFVYNDSKDLEIEVTTIVDLWANSIAQNYGFIIKHSSSLEYHNDNDIVLKYFSRDTHTIYPPSLEFRWDDSVYNIGSGSQVSNSNIVISLQNNGSTFNQSDIHNFRITARDKYPVRVFQTSSVYSNYKFLPSSSYYAIRDMNTKEMVVDFDTNYTKISADSQGNYFRVYMNGLEPERYYSILIKSIIGGEEIVFDDEYYFKLVR